MLSDKPKLIFTDIAGKPTIEARLPSQQIKTQHKPSPSEQYQTALYNFGESVY